MHHSQTTKQVNELKRVVESNEYAAMHDRRPGHLYTGPAEGELNLTLAANLLYNENSVRMLEHVEWNKSRQTGEMEPKMVYLPSFGCAYA